VLQQKTSILLLVTLLVALSGTLVWLYVFDDIPKKTPTRAKQVMHYKFEHNSLSYCTHYTQTLKLHLRGKT
jgi:hypothetical protein